jgi:MYXO-CTERM domain-containing protein
VDITAPNVSGVPEPATLAPAVLAALAGVGLAWRKRRRAAA